MSFATSISSVLKRTASPLFAMPQLRLSLGVFSLALGVLALGTATLPMIARIQLLSGDFVREDVFAGRPVKYDDLIRLRDTREKVSAEIDLNSVWGDLAMARLEILKRDGMKGPDVMDRLAQALDAQKKALAAAPADVYGWARHTYLLLQQSVDHPDAVKSLMLEMDAAPYEPTLIQSRVNMALYLYPRMDDAMRARMPSFFRLAWKMNMKETEKAAKVFGRSQLLESALLDDPETKSWLGGRSLGKP